MKKAGRKIEKNKYLGFSRLNENGDKYTVVRYGSYSDVDVLFELTGYVVKTGMQRVLRGHVKDRLSKTAFGVGFIGVGDKGKNHKAYNTWRNMMARCYDKKSQSVRKSYIGCTVCEEWHDFQNFAKWYDINLPSHLNRPELDKDIRYPGNKIYSPKTCLIVDKSENLNELTERRQKGVALISPFGQRFAFRSQTEASWIIGCSQTGVWMVSAGKRDSVRGWRLTNENE